MEDAFWRGVWVFTGLCVANFGYDLFSPNTTWADSFEHSFFQFIAIAIMVVLTALDKRKV